MQVSNPIDTLAAAVYVACARDLPFVIYQDRDWSAYEAMTAQMSDADRLALTFREQEERRMVGPTVDRRRRHEPSDVSINLFEQLWPHEGLGYEGDYPQAFTKAYTVVVTSRHVNCSAVYFGPGAKLAYIVPADARTLLRDFIAKQKLPSVQEAESIGWTDNLHDHPYPFTYTTPMKA